jgi:class 3 adenylate cyclase
MDVFQAYIPHDRRLALARGEALPDRLQGAVLFADISGFTPLTEALARSFGPRRGAEELTFHLNRIYDALISEVERFHGSVVSFSGDAITCWFDSGILPPDLCSSSPVLSSFLSFFLAVKAAVASGSAGVSGRGSSNSADRYLAGALLDRLAAANTM